MSNILETLYILVKLETEDLKKGLDQSQAKVKQLEERFESVGRASEHAGGAFLSTLKSVVQLAAGFASFHAILSGAHSAIQSIRDIGDVSRELNVDASALDAWGHAVQRTGGSAAQFQSTLASLADHFQTTNDIALRALPRLADVFSKLNFRQAQVYGKHLGIDQATILLLQQGRREVEDVIKQQQRLGLVTKEQIEITRKYDNSLYDARRAYSEFYRQLVTPLLPGITKVFNYLIEHKDLVVGTFIAIGGSAALLSAPFIAANAAVIGVTAAITALIAAFALVFEDIKKFKEGAPSVTGYINKQLDKGLKASDNLPHWLQVLTGRNALASGSTTTSSHLFDGFSGFSNPFSNFNLNTLTGHNALSPKNTTVNIGEVNVITQATNSQEMANSVKDSLHTQIGQLLSQMDNGVYA